MRVKKAKMFNKRAANPKYKADQIIQTLSLKPGQIIADIGSGGGYFAYRFAEAVGEKGQVYAIDTNQEFLEFVKTQAKDKGLNNIVTKLTSSENPGLSKNMFDYIFLRNVTHHLQNRVYYFQRLKETLRPGGKLVIIEYDERGSILSFHRFHKHLVPRRTLLEETKKAGYIIKKSYDFLPEQSFMIFSIK